MFRHLTFHRCIFWLHLFAGLLAGIIILSMSVSGLLISYETQLMEWANRGLRVSPPVAGAARLPVETLLAKMREAKPELSPSGISWQSDRGSPVIVSIGREGTFFVNPYSGVVLGTGNETWHDFFHWMTDWHRFLGQEGESRDIGKAITGAGTLVFGVLLLSGIYLWWPRHWRGANLRAALLFNRQLKGRARDWNWHNVIGFWSSFPMLLIILTGLIMSYGWANNLLYTLTGTEPPPPRTRPAEGGAGGRPGGPQGAGEQRPGPGRGSRPEGNRPAGPLLKLDGLNPLLAKVEQQQPGWLKMSLRMPMAPGGPLPLMVDRGGRGQPHLRTMWNLDLTKGEVATSADNFAGLNLGRRLRMYARFLHTGELFGFVGQTIAALCTLSAIMLIWTGFALAYRRFFKSRKKAE